MHGLLTTLVHATSKCTFTGFISSYVCTFPLKLTSIIGRSFFEGYKFCGFYRFLGLPQNFFTTGEETIICKFTCIVKSSANVIRENNFY